jgi:hypothetical protein
MPWRLSFSCAFGLALAWIGAGCSGAGRPVKVNGIVTVDGTPVRAAIVTFAPLAAAGGRAASGQTDDTGAFHLTTFTTGDGALPGEYKVIVTHRDVAKDEPGWNWSEQMDAKQRKAFMMKTSPQGMTKERKKKVRSLVPKVYGSVENTPLRQVVPASGTVRLDLKKSAP